MKLVVEELESISVLSEDVGEGKEPEYYLEGIFLQANKKNRNGRIYPMKIMKPAVEKYKAEYIEKNRAFGELGHPTSANPNINFERVSHLITDIWQDGDYFRCRAKILDTPYGRIAKEFIKNGCTLGVSSRAMGSVHRENGVDVVNNDFRIITAGDIVWEPSAQTAFPQGLMEDVEWEYDAEKDEYYKVENKVDFEALSNMQAEEFKTFLEELVAKGKDSKSE